MPTMSLVLDHKRNTEISLQEIFTARGRTHFHPTDDNVKDDGASANYPLMGRTFGVPQRHTASRWVYSGTRVA